MLEFDCASDGASNGIVLKCMHWYLWLLVNQETVLIHVDSRWWWRWWRRKSRSLDSAPSSSPPSFPGLSLPSLSFCLLRLILCLEGHLFWVQTWSSFSWLSRVLLLEDLVLQDCIWLIQRSLWSHILIFYFSLLSVFNGILGHHLLRVILWLLNWSLVNTTSLVTVISSLCPSGAGGLRNLSNRLRITTNRLHFLRRDVLPSLMIMPVSILWVCWCFSY